MKLKKNKAKVIEIYNSVGGVIAEAARIYCAKFGYEYNDTRRRAMSTFLAKEGISKKRTFKTDPSNDSEQKWEENTQKDTAYLEQLLSSPVKTLEDLVQVCNIDLAVWEIERYVCNTWGVTSWQTGSSQYRTNYQVKAWLKKKDKTYGELLEEILPIIKKYKPKPIVTKVGKGTGVLTLADFHIGAEVKDLLKTKDFNLNVLMDYIDIVVDTINSHGFDRVHVNLLGDYFESLSGLSHDSTFKSLGQGMWGANPIILASEIISKRLLEKIHNLVEVNMVSGNHDRMTISNKVDNTGEGGKVLWYIVNNNLPTIPVNYHNSVITKEIDGINYLLTHGDKSYSKKDFSKFVLDYGSTDIYNLVMEGHLHTRKTLKSMSTEKKYYQEVEVVSYDDANYRKLVVPSLFTGNWFSESLGFGGNSGCIITTNNGKGLPHVLDYSL